MGAVTLAMISIFSLVVSNFGNINCSVFIPGVFFDKTADVKIGGVYFSMIYSIFGFFFPLFLQCHWFLYIVNYLKGIEK
jgi:hypothetical protein